jgi:hypothetical protein
MGQIGREASSRDYWREQQQGAAPVGAAAVRLIPHADGSLNLLTFHGSGYSCLEPAVAVRVYPI